MTRYLHILGILIAISQLVIYVVCLVGTLYGLIAMHLHREKDPESYSDKVFIQHTWVLRIAAIPLLMSIILTSVMLHGIRKKRPNLMIPWILFYLLYCLINCFSLIWSVVEVFKTAALHFLFAFLSLCFHMVCLYYITELYKEMLLSSLEDYESDTDEPRSS